MKDASGPNCRIKIALGNEIREELIAKSAFTIGRGRDSDIQIVSPNISRVHLSVEIRENTFWVSDFGSANGSFINNKEIGRHQAIQYKIGDQIRLGESKEIIVLEFREAKLTAPPPPPAEINLDETKPDAHLHAAQQALAQPVRSVVIDHSAVERILNQARALAAQLKDAAEIEAKKILNGAQTGAFQISAEAKLQAIQIMKEAEDGTKSRVEEIIRKAHRDGDQVLAEYKPRAEKLVADARIAATTIKNSAQEETDGLLNDAYQKCNTLISAAEETVSNIDKEAKRGAELILNEAQGEVDRILRDTQESSRKIRIKNEQDLSEIKLDSEKKAQQRLDQAKNECDKIIAHASAHAESQKQNLLARANEEAKDIINEATRKAKLSSQEITRQFQDDHVKLGQTKESLERNISRLAQQRDDAEKHQIEAHDALLATKHKLDEVQKQLGEAELLTKKRGSELHSQILNLEESLAGKTKAIEKLETGSLEVLAKRKQEEEITLQLRSESVALQTKVKDLQTQQTQLETRLSSLDKQIDQERSRLKESLDSEMSLLRKDATLEIKKIREQANVDHAKSRASQDSELANLKNKELDLIKTLRAEADAKTKLAKKHQAIEMARALEIYLTPKLQSALKLQDLPAANFQTFFQDITAVVTNLMVDDSASGADPGLTQSASSMGIPVKQHRARKKVFAAVAGVAIVGFASLFYYQEKYGDHRSASEIFAEELRDREAKKPKFVPDITNDYKHSYTDNVIFTESYTEFKSDPKQQSKWIRDLNKFFINDLKLNENSVVRFIPLESGLISQLQEKQKIIHFETQTEDIRLMRELEVASVDRLTEIVGGEKNYKAFREFEKNYFQQHRMPASK